MAGWPRMFFLLYFFVFSFGLPTKNIVDQQKGHNI
jgi:hypothetical protein